MTFSARIGLTELLMVMAYTLIRASQQTPPVIQNSIYCIKSLGFWSKFHKQYCISVESTAYLGALVRNCRCSAAPLNILLCCNQVLLENLIPPKYAGLLYINRQSL